MSVRHTGSLLAVCLALCFTACRSKITGNQGNLEFSYVADDDIRDFNKPIAVGGKLELKVAQAGNSAKVTLESASTDTPAVLAVDSFAGDKLILVGKSAGGALVKVTAKTTSGTSLDDSVNMLAAVPEVLALRHYCTGENEGLYLVNRPTVLISFDMSKKNGQSVIGYGYHPVALTPSTGVLTLDEATTDQASLHFATAATKGTATIKSTIDDSQLSVRLVEPKDIDGATLLVSKVEVRAGTTLPVHVWPTVASKPICQPTVGLTVASDTADICEVTGLTKDGTATSGEGNSWVNVKGLKLGVCKFTVTFAQGAGGAGATQQLSVDVLQGP